MAILVGKKAISRTTDREGKNQMSKRFLLSASLAGLALFQALPAMAQSATTATPLPAATQRTATPALWVVKDSDTTIYLFGTFHLLPDGLNWNLGPVKAAFESADTLRLEIANLEAETPAIGAIMAEKGRLPAGQSLNDGLTEVQKAELARIVAQSGIPPEAIMTMRPWVASMVLALTMYQKLGLDPTKGVDKTLDGLARARKIPVEGFETAVQQIGFFASMTQAQERALLLSTLEEWDKGQVDLDRMVNAWARGDANRIGIMMSDSLRAHPQLATVLLTDRNRRWADWIAGRMATPGTVFVAVGAGHLAGRDSVQSYLRKKGLQARRVANPAR
jgi:uncharacterized protein